MNDLNILFEIYDLKPYEYHKGYKMSERIENQSIKQQALSFLEQLKILEHSTFGSYCYEHYVSGWS